MKIQLEATRVESVAQLLALLESTPAALPLRNVRTHESRPLPMASARELAPETARTVLL